MVYNVDLITVMWDLIGDLNGDIAGKTAFAIGALIAKHKKIGVLVRLPSNLKFLK